MWMKNSQARTKPCQIMSNLFAKAKLDSLLSAYALMSWAIFLLCLLF